MVVISKDLENAIKNKFVLPYLTILKENQYLVITDEDDVIQGRFVNVGNKLIEIFNIFGTKEINNYIGLMYPLSFFVRDIDKWELLKFNVFDRKGYVQFMKNNLKKNVEQVIKSHGDDNDTYSMMKEKIEKYGGKVVSFETNDDGLLVGATTTDEDLYWVYVDKDFKVHVSSAVGGFKVVENPDDSFNNLLHVAQNEPENIAHLINERVEDTIDYIFTDIKIRADEE